MPRINGIKIRRIIYGFNKAEKIFNWGKGDFIIIYIEMIYSVSISQKADYFVLMIYIIICICDY